MQILLGQVMINDKHCFELYGYDVIVDSQLRPWLLEVNHSPSLAVETELDADLKTGLLADVMRLDLDPDFGERVTKIQRGGRETVNGQFAGGVHEHALRGRSDVVVRHAGLFEIGKDVATRVANPDDG